MQQGKISRGLVKNTCAQEADCRRFDMWGQSPSSQEMRHAGTVPFKSEAVRYQFTVDENGIVVVEPGDDPKEWCAK